MLCATYLPLDICDADFLASLLVVVVPFAIGQLDARELGARFYARRKEFSLSLEFYKFQASAVKLEDVDLLGRIALWVGCGRGLDVRRVFSLQAMSAVGRGEEGVGQKDLTVLTPPDKVGFTLAAALLVHLEAVYRDGVGVYFAT
jgi:hypothetical protein